MEVGRFLFQVEDCALCFSDKQSETIQIRIDAEIANTNDAIQWEKSGTSTGGSEQVTACPASKDGSIAYNAGFTKNGFAKSSCIDLTNASVSSIINGILCVRAVAVTDGVAAKGSKEVVKQDEPLIEFTVPLASILSSTTCSVSHDGNFLAKNIDGEEGEVASSNASEIIPVISVKKSTLKAENCSIKWRFAADNDLAQYVVGSCVFQWEKATLENVPSMSWAHACPDVIDPKAKVPATAEELRKRYVENVGKLITSPPATANLFSISINKPVQVAPATTEDGETGAAAVAEGEEKEVVAPAATSGLSDIFPTGSLPGGLLGFDTNVATELVPDVDADMREMHNLWSLGFDQASQYVFFHRSTCHLLRNMLSSTGANVDGELPTGSQLPVTISISAPEGAPAIEKDGELNGSVDMAKLVEVAGTTKGCVTTSLSLPIPEIPEVIAEASPEGSQRMSARSNKSPRAAGSQPSSKQSSPRAAAAEETAESEPMPEAPAPIVCTLTLHFTLSRALCPGEPPSTTPLPDLSAGGLLKTFVSKALIQSRNRNIRQELKEDITGVVRQVALEYVALYPAGTPNTTMVDAAGNSVVVDRRVEFLHYLSTSGVYHSLKERLKPSIQRAVREMYGSRGRALDGNHVGGVSSDGIDMSDESEENKAAAAAAVDSLLGELYVFLVKETNVVLNQMYTATIVARDTMELEQSALIDDQKETLNQLFERNLLLALNCEADDRFSVAEQYHMERLQMVATESTLTSNELYIHSAYSQFGMYLQRRVAAAMTLQASVARTTVAVPEGDVIMLGERAREAIEIAVSSLPSAWESAILLICMLLECGQHEKAMSIMQNLFQIQLSSGVGSIFKTGGNSPEIFDFQQFDGYESDDLVSSAVNPLCYVVLAVFFKMQNKPLNVRRALLLAQRCYTECNCQPPVSALGKPRRTIVLCLARACVYLFEYGFITLGNACAELAKECEAAIADKALSRGMMSDSVPTVRHVMARVSHLQLLLGGVAAEKTDQVYDAAYDAATVSMGAHEQAQGWLDVAHSYQSMGAASDRTLEAYGCAFMHATQSQQRVSQQDSAVSSVKFVVPLCDVLTYAKLLIACTEFEVALKMLLQVCMIEAMDTNSIVPKSRQVASSSLFMLIGICCLKLDRLSDAEDALQEANLLENRNPEIWAYLSLFCLQSGVTRTCEAEKALEQALRLGLANAVLFRELAIAYIAIDKLLTAEDLVRRSLALEVATSLGGRASGRTRKLLGDVLAGQNQATKAIEEYQSVLQEVQQEVSQGEETATVEQWELRIAAGENCINLLRSLGRDEEAVSVTKIVEMFRSQLPPPTM